MPWTPWRSTSSATRKASTIEVLLSSTDSRRLLGTTISVSTSLGQLARRPSSACSRAARALEAERLGDDAHGERAELAGDPRHDRARPRAGPAAGAGGHEDHVRALEQRLDLVVLLHRGLRGRGPGLEPEPSPRVTLGADVQRDVRGRLLQRLEVGVDGDELDALDLGLDHAVDGVDARRRRRRPRAARAAAVARRVAAVALGGLGRRVGSPGRRRRCRARAPGCSRGSSRRRRGAGAPRRGHGSASASSASSARGGLGRLGLGGARARPAGRRAARARLRRGRRAAAAPRPPSSVLRNRAASGPSRMLARLPLSIPENLLRQLAIGVGRRPVRIVLEHRHALHGCLREAHGLADPRGEHPVAEVLLQDLDRLLGVDRTACRRASGRIPSISMSGLRFSRIMARVFWSWISPRMDRYSHWTGTITLSAAVRALIVSSPRLGGVSMQTKS